MVKLKIFSMFALLTVAFSATAQVRANYGGTVEILELDDNRATFSSVGADSDDDNVLIAAEKNLFQKLFYDGVEGFNGDKPLVERNTSALETFYQTRSDSKRIERRLPYKAYVVSSQLEGEPKKNDEGMYTGTATIVVNYKRLISYLKMNKAILGEDSVVVIKENVKVGRPNFLKRRHSSQ